MILLIQIKSKLCKSALQSAGYTIANAAQYVVSLLFHKNLSLTYI